jgi:hypothetical protein
MAGKTKKISLDIESDTDYTEDEIIQKFIDDPEKFRVQITSAEPT